LIGLSGINAPLYVYTSKWFERRRGSALALISSGTYIAGGLWPPIFERIIAYGGWGTALLGFAALEVAVVVPLAVFFLRRPPELIHAGTLRPAERTTDEVLGWPPNVVFALLCVGVFMCCIPMAMPQTHMVAFCSDIGISAAHGA